MNTQYTITLEAPENSDELYGAWCEELKLSAFRESESEAFYNLVENIPAYFEVKNEEERTYILRSHIKTRLPSRLKEIKISAFS